MNKTTHKYSFLVYVLITNGITWLCWLSQALELAAPEGFLRIFLDEGEAHLDLLPKARQAAPELVDAILGSLQAESGNRPWTNCLIHSVSRSYAY